jgi:hypothetical protein
MHGKREENSHKQFPCAQARIPRDYAPIRFRARFFLGSGNFSRERVNADWDSLEHFGFVWECKPNFVMTRRNLVKKFFAQRAKTLGQDLYANYLMLQ